jgi:hypothetical protein
MKRTLIVAALMILSLFLLQIEAAAELHIPSPDSVLTNGIDRWSDQETQEFVIANFDTKLPVRLSAPQDLAVYRTSNSEAQPFASQLLAKAANKGITLKNNILLKLRI